MQTKLNSSLGTFPKGAVIHGLILTALLFFLFVSQKQTHPVGNHSDVYSLSGFTMGTSYQVQISNIPGGLNPLVLAEKIQNRLQYLDKEIFSTYADSSELSRFNRSLVNVAFPASRELLEVIISAQAIYQESNQAFDITVSPLVNLWGFGASSRGSTNTLPTTSQIEHALSLLANEAIKVSLQQSTLLKTKALQIDLSGIAKGYAVDQVADLLQGHGIENFLVEIGGEIKVRGYKKKAMAGHEVEVWTFAIESPNATLSETFTSFSNHGESFAVASSGDYRNYFELDGQHYSHEINPLTGRPVTHNLAAVTVIAETATRADAHATALMVMGPEQGFDHASSMNLAAYFIIQTDAGFATRYTKSFDDLLK